MCLYFEDYIISKHCVINTFTVMTWQQEIASQVEQARVKTNGFSVWSQMIDWNGIEIFQLADYLPNSGGVHYCTEPQGYV